MARGSTDGDLEMAEVEWEIRLREQVRGEFLLSISLFRRINKIAS